MSRLVCAVVCIVLTAGISYGQRHKLASINAETPEGALLQQIGMEKDAAKRTALLEEFGQKYGKHEAAGWVLSQLQTSYQTAGEADKTISTGERLLAADPDDLDAAYANLKAAEKKNDPDAIIKWSDATSAAARKAVSGPKAADVDDDAHAKAVDYAKQVDIYTEYSVYASALSATDPAKVLALGDALEKRNAESQYLPQVMSKYALAARQANQFDKGVAFGERALQRKQVNDDMLLLLAENAMNKQQFDKTQGYSNQLIALWGTQAKPQQVSDADWEKKKAASMGAAYWFQGVAAANQNNFSASDKALRSAMPLIKDNAYMLASASFYLGLADYKMASSSKNAKLMQEALKYSQQSAAMKGPFQAQAAKNVKVIQQEIAKL